MILFVFPLCSRSHFVPYLLEEYKETLRLPVVSKAQLDGLVAKNGKVVAMGFSDKVIRAKEIKQAFYELSRHYSEDAVFVILDKHEAKKEVARFDGRLPAFWIYSNGTLLSIYPYLDNENAFARILELVFHGDELQIAITMSDLLGLIGDTN
jgi:hypothetical protein